MNNVELLSFPISTNSPGYGGHNHFNIKKVKDMGCGDSCNQSEWTINNHLGTHIDMPAHFVKDGLTVTDYTPDFFMFDNVVLVELGKINEDELITPSHFKNLHINEDCNLLLVKTNFEKVRNEKKYWNNNPGFAPETGDWLKQNFKSLRMIGFDFISLTSFQNRDIGRIAHKHFLNPEFGGRSLLIIEDMKLSPLKVSPSKVLVSPLMVEDSDGSPTSVWAFP